MFLTFAYKDIRRLLFLVSCFCLKKKQKKLPYLNQKCFLLLFFFFLLPTPPPLCLMGWILSMAYFLFYFPHMFSSYIFGDLSLWKLFFKVLLTEIITISSKCDKVKLYQKHRLMYVILQFLRPPNVV